MIPKDIVQSIVDASRIEAVVADFVALKKRGANYIGLCPFHNEKTPSFTVSATKGIYKCFGCGKAGDSVNFVMEHEHYTYLEALRFLAKKFQIEIVEVEATPEQKFEQDEKESLYNIHAFAQKYFSEFLFTQEEGKSIGLSYLKEREFTEDIIRKFHLGYCPASWSEFTQHALKSGYNIEMLIKSGLTVEKDNDHYDRFRGRVLFPIYNITGRVIGFGGRIIKKDPSKPKYINSPESDIYNKSKALYGLFFAKNAITTSNNCYLVEGYTDVISLHQADILNVVASSGTSLTTDQIRLIKRFTNNITILYDGDEAGLKASFRGIDMILEQGMNVRVVMFPEGEDPDSYARNKRPAELESFLKTNAQDFIRMKTDLLREEAKNDPVKKSGIIREVLGSVAIIPDLITRSMYVKECAMLLSIDENTLIFELNKILRSKHKPNTQPEVGDPAIKAIQETRSSSQQSGYNPKSSEMQELAIIRLLFLYGSNDIVFEQPDDFGLIQKVSVNVAHFIVNDLARDEIVFENPLFQKIFNEYKQFIDKNEIPDIRYFTSYRDENIRNLAIEQMSQPYELSEKWKENKIYVNGEEQKLKQTVTSSILALKDKVIKKMIFEIEKSLKTATNNDETTDLMIKHQSYKNLLNQINKALGRVITP